MEQQQTFTLNGSEFDAALAEISIGISHAIATCEQGSFTNIEERLRRTQVAVVRAMAMLPQSMQDEIVALTRAALARLA